MSKSLCLRCVRGFSCFPRMLVQFSIVRSGVLTPGKSLRLRVLPFLDYSVDFRGRNNVRNQLKLFGEVRAGDGGAFVIHPNPTRLHTHKLTLSHSFSHTLTNSNTLSQTPTHTLKRKLQHTLSKPKLKNTLKRKLNTHTLKLKHTL